MKTRASRRFGLLTGDRYVRDDRPASVAFGNLKSKASVPDHADLFASAKLVAIISQPTYMWTIWLS